MGGALNDYSAWVGRSEESRDRLTAGPLDRLAATLDRDDPRARDGDVVPPLAHWLFFLPDARQSEIGPDGHQKRGGFLPPVHELPRRMWAGSRIAFPGDIRVGDLVTRRSTIKSVTTKEGSSGPLVFVTVRHEIGREGEPVAIVDEHDIVYRGLEAPAAKPAPAAPAGAWHRQFVPDAVMLFRYSALTFNGHRIHYDRDYVTREEGYPGLVVHGPLTATLLLDLIRRNAQRSRIARFSFRAVSPLFDGNEMSLDADPPNPGGIVKAWARNHEGRLAMTAEAVLE
ncbi:MaoC family dehydratase N-terminal domain-containing protein [Pseudaminobacter sp. 19-2017]|uniref:MaoC family dehydratase N-terminal domain-containing protein n=1 Tax=Pseudaminobacter soli (ex Zhang et al. 2022) TaxID=2831468 RepID=A0A942I9M5_9HYPH|nr:MaoC family dehydratase N-terminal domain-containing protein [Pseudaminobacter soli]MBS3650465.1 MaoC family dehydratase N-terminal domain-containing protein [Pseudaminobacter soli]